MNEINKKREEELIQIISNAAGELGMLIDERDTPKELLSDFDKKFGDAQIYEFHVRTGLAEAAVKILKSDAGKLIYGLLILIIERLAPDMDQVEFEPLIRQIIANIDPSHPYLEDGIM